MKRVKFFIFLLPAIIFLFASPHFVLAETIDLTSTADSFVNDGYPDNNYGSAHSMVTSHNSVFRWGLVRFDLASVPTNSIIDSATLKLYLHETSGDASVPLMVSRILNDWSESGVKWNNRPMFDESTGVSINVDSAFEYKSWEITNFVKGWLNGDFSNYGVAVGYGGGTFARTFRTREYTSTSNRPILTINYHLPEPSPTPSPSPTPEPTPTSEAIPSPAEEETSTPTPEESPTPTPEEEEKAGGILGLSTGQTIIGGLILLSLVGAGIAFAIYARRKPAKKPKEKKEEKPEEIEEG